MKLAVWLLLLADDRLTGGYGALRRCGGVPLSSCEPMRALSVMASCMAMHVENMRHMRFPPALTWFLPCCGPKGARCEDSSCGG